MNSTQLHLKTVTPMFLRGYDNESLELRPPAFKALFRYWWRAAVGEINADNLREEESRLFGNTQGRSPLSIRIPRLSTTLSFGKYPPLPHQPGFTNQAYLPDSKFDFILTAPQLPQLNEYEEIAKLSFLLGGVGNRSRRGFGSICYQNWSFNTVQDLQNKVFQVLDGISPGRFLCQPNQIQLNTPAPPIPDYPVIKAIHFGVRLWTNVDDLLCRIGQATHAHCDEALGGINPRMASPIHVRVQKVDDRFVPVITQLNSVFPDAPPHDYERKQADFIAAILE